MTLSPERSSHPYHMHDAIMGQPQAIARVITGESGNVSALADLVQKSARVHVVGIGTSWHAALVGEDLLRNHAGRREARAWNSYEFCDRPPLLTADDVVIVLSHRGTKTYSARALELARHSGAATALLTGIGSDARRDLAQVVVETSQPDPSSAFTISHTSALTALTMLAVALSGGDPADSLSNLPDAVQDAISTEDAVKEWAAASTDIQRFYFVGTGTNASTAYEAALKMKEANYTTTEGLHLEQYLHGPFVSTDEGCLVTFIAPPSDDSESRIIDFINAITEVGPGRMAVLPPPSDDSEDRVIDIINAVNEVGARTAAVLQEGDSARSDLVDTAVSVPHCPEIFDPIVYLVPLQLFTYWLALELGCNPDVFRLDDPKHVAARRHYTL